MSKICGSDATPTDSRFHRQLNKLLINVFCYFDTNNHVHLIVCNLFFLFCYIKGHRKSSPRYVCKSTASPDKLATYIGATTNLLISDNQINHVKFYVPKTTTVYTTLGHNNAHEIFHDTYTCLLQPNCYRHILTKCSSLLI